MPSGPVVHSNHSIGSKSFNFFCVGKIYNVAKHFDAERLASIDDFFWTTKRSNYVIYLQFQERLQLRLVLWVRFVDDQVDAKWL